MKKVIQSLVIISAFAGICLSSAQAEERRLALLVQVSEYQNNGVIASIRGPGEVQVDVQDMEATLKAPRYRFVSKILEQRNATHDAILRALEGTVQEANPGDAVVFYFNGHGINDAKQFRLCPYDVMTNSFRNDLTETEIHRWVTRMRAKRVTNITIILDSCYSLPGAGHTPPDTERTLAAREKFWDRPLDVPDERPVAPLSAKENVVLVAAGKGSTSYEGLMRPSRPTELEGVYTAFLCDELKKANPETTFRQLSIRVSARVTECINNAQKSNQKKFRHPQTPVIFGSDAWTTRKLFSAPPVDAVVGVDGRPDPKKPDDTRTPDNGGKPDNPGTPGYATVIQIDGNQITIDRGAEAGVKTGDVYDLYPPGEQEFPSRRKEGSFRIERVMPNRATGTLQGSPQAHIARENRAIQTAQQLDLSQNTEIVVQVEGTDHFKSVMKAELGQFPFIKTVDKSQDQPHQIVLRGRETMDGRLEATVYGSDGEVQYISMSLNGGGATYYGDDAAALRERLTPFLGQLITVQTLFQQVNPSPAFNITLTSNQPSYEIGKDRGNFTFQTETEGSLFLFDIDSAGTPSLLFPSSYDEDNHVSDHVAWNFPRLGKPYSFNKPEGTDRLIAFLITDKTVADAIRSRLFSRTASTAKGARLTLVINDLQKIDLQSTTIWNKVICGFLTFHREEPHR